MKIAIPVWRGQVSTVFDFAQRLFIVDVDNKDKTNATEFSFDEESLASRVRTLSRLGTEVLICGSISSELAAMVTSSGIEIVSSVKGQVKEVLAAFLAGEIDDPRFLLSGSEPETVRQERFKSRRCR